MPDLITDGNQELRDEDALSPAVIAREVMVLHAEILSLRADLLEQIRAVRADISALLAAWREYEPVLGAFRRGGVLAARTAARNGRKAT